MEEHFLIPNWRKKSKRNTQQRWYIIMSIIKYYEIKILIVIIASPINCDRCYSAFCRKSLERFILAELANVLWNHKTKRFNESLDLYCLSLFTLCTLLFIVWFNANCVVLLMISLNDFMLHVQYYMTFFQLADIIPKNNWSTYATNSRYLW